MTRISAAHKTRLAVLLLSFSLGTVSGCGRNSPAAPANSCGVTYNNNSPLMLNGIEITPAFPQIRGGGSQAFKATAFYGFQPGGPTEDCTTSVTWLSSVPTVATIDSSGVATGVTDGETLIQAALGSFGGSNVWTVLTIWETVTFLPTGSLNAARWLPTATLLNNGKVLIAGGFGASTSAELYDPVSGTFAATGNMISLRYQHTATLLNNGKVLVVGGLGNQTGFGLSSAELYDPATGTFAATGNLTTGRAAQTATLLSNGKVLISGGFESGTLASAELYDPATGAFSFAGNMSSDRANHTATLLNDGRVLIVGGHSNAVFPGKDLASAELYDPTSGTFTATTSMSSERSEHTATLLNDGTVLVAGGKSSLMPNTPLSTAEVYDPIKMTFASVGSMFIGRSDHTATLLSDGLVLIAGGSGSLIAHGTPALGNAELYNAATRMFVPTGALTTAREGHRATLLNDGTVLLVGGEGISVAALNSAELYHEH